MKVPPNFKVLGYLHFRKLSNEATNLRIFIKNKHVQTTRDQSKESITWEGEKRKQVPLSVLRVSSTCTNLRNFPGDR
jgi:hypothetical protein